MDDEVVYFELNNWFGGRDYPDVEPFSSWMDDDLKQQFRNDDWCVENKLCVINVNIDMSTDYLITASKKWVEENCPELLDKYSEFLRYSDEDELDEPPYSKHITLQFLEYDEDNFGSHGYEGVENWEGYTFYVPEEDVYEYQDDNSDDEDEDYED